MNKEQFLSFMDFPIEWIKLGLYSDELLNLQMEDLIKDLSEKEELEKRINLKKYGGGSEHYRYGAFLFILRKNDLSVLDKIKIVVEKEPDTFLKKSMLKDIDKYLNINKK